MLKKRAIPTDLGVTEVNSKSTSDAEEDSSDVSSSDSDEEEEGQISDVGKGASKLLVL